MSPQMRTPSHFHLSKSRSAFSKYVRCPSTVRCMSARSPMRSRSAPSSSRATGLPSARTVPAAAHAAPSVPMNSRLFCIAYSFFAFLSISSILSPNSPSRSQWFPQVQYITPRQLGVRTARSIQSRLLLRTFSS